MVQIWVAVSFFTCVYAVELVNCVVCDSLAAMQCFGTVLHRMTHIVLPFTLYKQIKVALV